jgi:hypothetical protein
MEQWILDLAKRHRELNRYDHQTAGGLGQKELLWNQFITACDACVRTYSSCFGRPLFIVAERRHEGGRSRVVAEYNLRHYAVFDGGQLQIKSYDELMVAAKAR